MTRFIAIFLTACVRFLARVPLRWLHAVGTPLGWLVYAASPKYRRRFRANVAQAGVPWVQARGAVAAAGRLMMELPPLWLRPPDAPLPVTVHWQGGELIEAAQAAGRGLVMLTPHLGCFEAIGQSYAERYGAAPGRDDGAVPPGAQALAARPGRSRPPPAGSRRRAGHAGRCS